MGKANQTKGLTAIYGSTRDWVDAASNCIMGIFHGDAIEVARKTGKILLKKAPWCISNTEKNMTDFLSIKTQKTFKFKIPTISYPVLFNFIVKTKGTHLIRYSSLSVLLIQYCLSSSESRDNAVTDGAKSVKFLAGSDK